MLSKDAAKLLKRIVKSYHKRIKSDAENPTWFRVFQFKTEFKNLKIKDFEFAIEELAHLGLVKRYTDGGFAVTPNAIAYYENNSKALRIRIVWFIFGLFVEWLLCKGFDFGFEQIVRIISQIAEK